MRFAWAMLLLLSAYGCGGGGIFQEYEYEEELYLDVDGSATLYVNSSILALNALRGTSFDERPNAMFPRTELRQFFTTDATRVTRLSSSRRNNRRYVHVRLDVDDVRALGATPPFSWSDYEFERDGELLVYRQHVDGPPSSTNAHGLAGDEMVAFRIHVPSRIEFHNAGADNLRRGNIVVWEQSLAARLQGEPLELDVRMEPQSILNRTLWLFAASGLAVALMFGGLLFWLLRGPKGMDEHSRKGS